MLIFNKLTKREERLPAAYAMGIIANGLAVSLEANTAPIPVKEPQRHYDDGLVPIRLSNGDVVRMTPAQASRVVKNGVAVFLQEIDNDR